MNAEEYKNSLLGYKVGIKWKDGEQQIYEIVNENEKDIMNKKISINTEFAKSLNNKKVGDVVEFISNNIKNCYTIIALENIKLSDCITARNLTKLYHYTSLENIKSIFTYGLLNVNTLKENNIDFLGNDKLRLDKKNDCISCSLEYPNNKLLWTNIYNYSRRYCLLEIDINILKERKSFCCYTNAARFSGDLIMPIGNIDELFSGERNGLAENLPTDSQAEILVQKDIPITFIKKVIFYNNYDKILYQSIIPDNVEIVINKNLYKKRDKNE